ncbi:MULTISPECIES: ABC transporter ATP-binding protein [Rhodomicrobium]|uniref:ABC transporter ATP-binding protein n=1 Tax=Rhodomicrobium TaxID=1068 RepID=UPI000B4AB336|nr:MULTISPECIES: ABC transporter ATP-binding protein [Rhodomicrobium]
MSVKPLIRATAVGKDYNEGAVRALSNISVDLHENQITALVGPSGCGKTTLLRIIAGLDFPTRGAIAIDGKTVQGPGPDRGLIFQAYTSFPWLTAVRNVEYGLKILGIDKEERRQRALDFLKLVRLDHVADHYPRSLSGGMKQRVALARTLAQRPRIVLMDEPFGALDAQVRWEMQELLVELVEAEPRTVVIVTHDIGEALYLADRILFFSRQPGRIKADLTLDFKGGRRLKEKEELFSLPGYREMEKHLFSMMREEIAAVDNAA